MSECRSGREREKMCVCEYLCARKERESQKKRERGVKGPVTPYVLAFK